MKEEVDESDLLVMLVTTIQSLVHDGPSLHLHPTFVSFSYSQYSYKTNNHKMLQN